MCHDRGPRDVAGGRAIDGDHRRAEVATRADLSGPIDDPEASTLEIVMRLLQNAFIKAILPGGIAFYDSMTAKVIAHGADRATAIARMRVALSELVIEGIKSNIPLQQTNMLDQMFQLGGFNIHYLERRLAEARKS